jgi:hypothetical protein
MSKFNTYLNARYNDLMAIWAEVDKFSAPIMPFVRTYDLAEEGHIIATKAKIEALSGQLSTQLATMNLFTIFGQFDELYELIRQIMDIVLRPFYINLLTIGRSQTYSQELDITINFIKKSGQLYKEKYITSKQQIFEEISIDINQNIIDELIGAPSANQWVLFLIQKAIDGPFRGQVLTKLAQLKDREIMGPPMASDGLKMAPDSPIIQQLITRRRLSAQTRLMEAKALFEKLGLEWDESMPIISNMMASGAPFIFIKGHDVKSIVEYDMTPLTNIDIVKQEDLLSAPNSGINNRMIKRFDTIRLIKGQSDGPFNVIKAIKGAKEGLNEIINEPKVFIVEEIIGLYRLLGQPSTDNGQISDNNPLSVPGSLELATPTHVAIGLLLAPPMRPHFYNRICEDEILKVGINVKHAAWKASIEAERALSSKLATEVVKGQILDQLGGQLAKLIDEKMPTGHYEFKTLIFKAANRATLEHIFFDNLADKIRNDDEYIITMTIHIYEAIKRFTSALSSATREQVDSKFKEAVFKAETEANKREFLLGLFRDIVKGVISQLDVAPSYWKEPDNMKINVIKKYREGNF